MTPLTISRRFAVTLFAIVLSLPHVSRAAETGAPSALVQVTPLARHTLKEAVTAFGRVQPDPDRASSLTLARAGRVTRLWVRPGQRVVAGQKLLRLDTAPDARMQYQQAEAAVQYARGNLARVQRLFREQLATREQIAAAQRRLREAEARFQAQHDLGNDRATETVRAPFAGIVTQIAVSQDQRVQPDTLAVVLARGDALVVSLGLEQEDAVRVRPGQEVVLSSVFRPDARMDAQVGEVHAMVNPATRLVDVVVRVPRKNAGGVVLGEAMRGVIALRQEQVLAVPRSAVLQDDRGAYVFVVRDGHAHRVPVVTGIEADGLVGVSGALQPGDAIVISGNYELSDGMAVRMSPS